LGLFGGECVGSVALLPSDGELVGVFCFLGFTFGLGVGESVRDFLEGLGEDWLLPDDRRPPDPRFRMLPRAARGLDWVIPALAKICVCLHVCDGE